MKNMFIKVLSVVMALTMIMGAFGTIALADECDHEYGKTEVEPTCITDGYIINTCNKCGKSFNEKGKDKLTTCDEDTIIWDTEGSDATCIDPAYTENGTCSICGKIYHGAPVEGKIGRAHV